MGLLFHEIIVITCYFQTQVNKVFPLSSVQVPSTDRNALSSLWGKLASEILMQNWEAAMEDLTRLRETIDNNVCKHYLKNKLRSPLLMSMFQQDDISERSCLIIGRTLK